MVGRGAYIIGGRADFRCLCHKAGANPSTQTDSILSDRLPDAKITFDGDFSPIAVIARSGLSKDMANKVPAHSRFVEAPDTPSSALSWFRDQGLSFNEHSFDWGAALYFPHLGELRSRPDGSIDLEQSPIITVHLPTIRRGTLWTVGDVCFCPVPLGQFPELKRVRRAFLQWFKECPLIYDHHPSSAHKFDYFLEGSAKNWGPIRAFPTGLAALQRGQYFISQWETDGSLKTLYKTLALRGVTCADSD